MNISYLMFDIPTDFSMAISKLEFCFWESSRELIIQEIQNLGKLKIRETQRLGISKSGERNLRNWKSGKLKILIIEDECLNIPPPHP